MDEPTMRSLAYEILKVYQNTHSLRVINETEIAYVLAARLEDTVLPDLIGKIGDIKR